MVSVASLVGLGSPFAPGSTPAHAVEIVFDLSLDVNGFFDDPAAAATLQAAGDFYSRVLTDTLDAIVPTPPGQTNSLGGQNAWDLRFEHPGTGQPQFIPGSQPNGFRIVNPTIPADTLVVYAGARDLDPNVAGGSFLATAGPGGWGGLGDNAWFDTIRNRGEPGFTTGAASEFAPWGGSLAVTTDTNWNLDHTRRPAPNENDLYSVVVHELAHVLGLGTSASWFTRSIGNEFRGFAARAANDNQFVPLQTPGQGHWAPGVTSTVYGTQSDQTTLTPVTQETALDPDILFGVRKLPTTVDLAGLDDIGWDLAPLLDGDLDFDQALTPDDADLLAQHFGIADQPYVQRFDLDGTGSVDAVDLRLWADRAAGTTPGDVNLDGTVDLLDAQTLVANYTGQATANQPFDTPLSWALGNTDGDGDIDFDDAMTLLLHAQTNLPHDTAAIAHLFTATLGQPVPEPTTAAGLLALLTVTRRRR